MAKLLALLNVREDKWRCRRKETIGKGLAIHTVDNVSIRKIIRCKILIAHCSRKSPLEKGIEEELAKNGSAALVAKNVAQWWSVHHDVNAIVKA